MRNPFLTLITLLLLFSFSECKKKDIHECIIPAVVPFQPYSDPVWHPNGILLGVNHTPLIGIGPNGVGPCIWYSYFSNPDSIGFYLMNEDGTGFRRLTDFTLSAPAWSPDGNWIAFSLGSNIYKMPFNGNTFDTTEIIQLTTTGGNFYPSWTANSDTIYYDSNNDSPQGTSFYSIWKMANNGAGKTRLTQSAGMGDTRQPFIGSDNRVYYVGYSSSQPEIFSMNKDGSNQKQLTFNGQNGNRDTPKFWQGNLFYADNGTLRVIQSNNTDIKLTIPCITYDISASGEIVYSKMEYDITKYNKQIGTLWIMNPDGSNNHQLTFNNF
jgi:hypothetical protein